ncbi:DUF802 domain-containing protein [Burkholderia sp. Ax-1719]|uniref:DUF802 domain-containing protein n=1 Tax=Burkholderia sp. Ax-1719 TaxID=2608334 RepID=UPI00142017FE|nr:DUF802 domain-containing protein [Burkholderia sp. Ax-1719]NIE68274.1 DUF802 domain-containing protein [Burkholderia sp. Ax-1719]
MSRLRIDLVVFIAGLLAVCWIGAAYVGSNPLALAVTLLIGACYIAGALELRRYRQATGSLALAVDALAAPSAAAPATLNAWLERLHPSLRSAVRARVEGERAALPGPALTPYLVGMLVLLGMLGTLLGMVTTLRGTGIALDGATDLDGIRTALAGPIRGLGFAFGTSIAGVASSAMLGLLSALCRRERIEAAQRLDAQVATTLRPFSHAHQREASFALMQRQAEALPLLAERLQSMMSAIERQSASMGERQIASQEAFLGNAEATYARLASTVGDSLKASAAESARAAGAAFAPVVEATMAGLARESAALHGTLTQAVERQLDGLTSGFEANATRVAGIWNAALDEQRRAGEALADDLQGALERFSATFETRSAHLVRDVDARLAASAAGVSQSWQDALARQEQAGEKLAGDNQQALAAAAATFEQHAATLVRTVGEAQASLQTQLAARDEARLATWRATLDDMSTALRDEWRAAGTQAADQQQAICTTLAQTADEIVARTEAHANSTLAEIARATETAAAAWQTASTQAAQRQQDVCETLASTAGTIAAQAEAHTNSTIAEITRVAEASSTAWQTASAQTAERQQAICDTLAQTAAAIAASTETHASGTIAQIARAAEANANAWQAASTQAAERQQAICDALTQTATAISMQTEAHASGTIAEIARAAEANASAWQAASTQAAERQQAICDALTQTATAISMQTEAHASGTIAEIARAAEANGNAWQAASTQAAERQQAITEALAQTANAISTQTAAHAKGTIEEIARAAEANASAWQAASTQAAERQQAICDALAHTANAISAQTEAHAKGTIEEIARAAETNANAWQAASTQAAERQQAISEALTQTANAISAQTEAHASGTIAEIARAAEANANAWQAASTQAAERQQAICAALTQTASAIAAQTEAHANGTIAEIARLVEAASEAPRVAAEVVGELRQKLHESMVQDTAMLEERGRLLATVTTLLDAVNHASTEQRAAIGALVDTSAALLERVGARFDQQVEAGAQTLEGVAAQVTGSAVEMSSLGDAFSVAVQHFGASNDKLMAQLERIEAALDKSLARSDDQLAYYVAQAREVVDLSLLSQKQIVDSLQRLAGSEAA